MIKKRIYNEKTLRKVFDRYKCGKTSFSKIIRKKRPYKLSLKREDYIKIRIFSELLGIRESELISVMTKFLDTERLVKYIEKNAPIMKKIKNKKKFNEDLNKISRTLRILMQ